MYQTLSMHWDGSTWTIFPVPHSKDESWLYDVDAVSATDIWAVGIGTAFLDGHRQTLGVHWDGTAWMHALTPSPAGATADLFGVAAAGPDDVWSVGSVWDSVRQAFRPLVEHWDGTVWTLGRAPNGDNGWNQLKDVVAISSADIWAVGYSGPRSQLATDTLVERWDGAQWSISNSPDGPESFNVLNAIAADSSGGLWAVGSSDDLSAGTGSPLVERCAG
jgi:hypothetical protein